MKPCSPRKVLAHVKAVLRRGAPAEPDEVYEVGALKIDIYRVKAVANGRELLLAHLASAPGSSVGVVLTEEPDGVAVQGRDEGAGIPDEDLPRIPDRFTRAKDSKGSSRLGLAIVQTLVQLHGGEVLARNLPGDAAFTVLLPR